MVENELIRGRYWPFIELKNYYNSTEPSPKLPAEWEHYSIKPVQALRTPSNNQIAKLWVMIMLGSESLGPLLDNSNISPGFIKVPDEPDVQYWLWVTHFDLWQNGVILLPLWGIKWLPRWDDICPSAAASRPRG